MIAFLERTGERLLAKIVPSATASAGCAPERWCEACPNSGGRKRVGQILFSCNVVYGACLLNAC
jgi:hypothetical protein